MSNPTSRKALEDIAAQLRGRSRDELQLVDVLALAETMVGSMQSFFDAVDASVYREFREIAETIHRTRTEVAAIQPSEINEERIPEAGRELDAIVRQTEEATHVIMGAAEALLGADASDPDAYKAMVDGEVMKIFEACAFQDITGQRISKVVETLKFVEGRIERLARVLGHPRKPDHAPAEPACPVAERRERLMLNGPQHEGEAMAQDEIDRILAGGT